MLPMNGHPIQIRLLGPPQVLRDGQPVEGWRSRKALGLLGYLALSDGPVTRPALAELLWPASDESRGRANLSWALNHVTGLLPGCLAADRHTLRFVRDKAGIFLDSDHFRRLKRRNTVEALEEAVSLVQGELLDGFSLDGCPDFELWLVQERERWQRLVADAWSTLIAHHRFAGNYETAVAYARRLLAYLPWQESAHRHLMLLLALSGRRSAALAQYEICRRLLAEELGVKPSAETTRLYEAIRSGDETRLAAAIAGAEPKSPVLAATPGARSTAPRHNLPRQFTSFVGRDRELAAIARRLHEPETGLITVTGPGGVGKTRLAVAAAAAHLGHFADGVFFVPLAPLTTPDRIVPALAGALQFPFDQRPDGATPEDQLLDWLAGRQALLVLDNFEHLTGGPDFLLQLLARAPEVKLLVTSRHHLNLQAETLLEIAGLPVPSAGEDDAAETYPSMRLFVDRARRRRYDFELAAHERPLAARLCSLLAGYPLALELAAALVASQPLEQILAQVSENLDILKTSMHDVPARHLSLRAVFLHSWHLLSREEQAALASLVVFRGGFSVDAFTAVSGAPEATLRGLVQKSLVQALDGERFDLHSLIVQYLRETLDDTTYHLAGSRHSAWYLGRAQVDSPQLLGEGQQAAMARLRQDQDNLSTAWQRAVRRKDLATIRSSVSDLYRYWTRQNHLQAGVAFFQRAADALAEIDPVLAAGLRLRAIGCIQWESYRPEHLDRALRDLAVVRKAGNRHDLAAALLMAGRCAAYAMKNSEGSERDLLAEAETLLTFLDDDEGTSEIAILWGYVEQQLANYAESRRWYREAAAALRRRGDQQRLAFVLFRHARMAFMADSFDEASELAGESLALHTRIGDQRGILDSQVTLGLVAYQAGLLDKAGVYFEESLELARYLGNRARVANNLNNLGVIAHHQCRYDESQSWFEQAQAEFEAMGSPLGVGLVLTNWGLLAEEMGDLDEAESLLQAALAVRLRVGKTRDVVITRINLGFVLEARGEVEAALDQFHRAARTGIDKAMPGWTVDALAGIALARLDAGRLEDGVALAGLALTAESLASYARKKLNARLEAMRVEISPQRLDHMLAQGRALDLDATARAIIEDR